MYPGVLGDLIYFSCCSKSSLSSEQYLENVSSQYYKGMHLFIRNDSYTYAFNKAFLFLLWLYSVILK